MPQQRRQRTGSLWSMLSALPHAASEAVSGLAASWHNSGELRRSKLPLDWNEGSVRSILCILDRTAEGCRRERDARHSRFQAGVDAPLPGSKAEDLVTADHLLIQRIQEMTADRNRSNVTRTQAYLEIYLEFPELHWALLAHLVSRNAGWNMTDLKGGLMSDLTDAAFKLNMYRFLERCNALIFQDAYPQLLLYKYSREQKRSCFHLLPWFDVSAFMTPFWERFWIERSSGVLSVALIINEQNYIEGRVVSHPFYREQVLQHPYLKIHEWTRLNQILFPLGDSRCRHELYKESILPLRPLIGLTVQHFADPSSRIKIGKSLYGMLFGYKRVLEGALHFVNCTPHLGSREEYWPALFTYQAEGSMDASDESQALLQSEWLPEGQRLYSPRLLQVWEDLEYESIPRYDWYQQPDMLRHVSKPSLPYFVDMTHRHRSSLERTSMAHDAGRWLKAPNT
ncbi:DUF2515 family protein [Paenibacillus sp. JSM ZJ436]|uniref:DUF2515 family protein n=1 Tax=Paenibacillus sp. JSM ZJ436 TaxID=3376190 RepID=UPI00378A0BFE